MKVIDDPVHGKPIPIIDPLSNKLDPSLRLGYRAGQTVYSVQRTGWYITTVYNPYGMGIGAHKKWLDVDWHDDMSNHHHILDTFGVNGLKENTTA